MKYFLEEMNYKVYAFEALSHFVKPLQQYLDEKPQLKKRAKLVAAGVGEEEGRINITYSKRNEEVKIVKLDDYIREYLDVLSIDIQGMEYLALRGARKLLKEVGVGMIWVEMLGGVHFKERNMEMCKVLDEQYILFDMVGWGRLKGNDTYHSWKPVRKNFYWDHTDRRGFQSWVDNYEKVANEGFGFVQTDVVGIRKDMATPQVFRMLERLGETVCSPNDPTTPNRCKFRKIAMDAGETF